MKFELKENVLTLYLEGELNSYNADNIEKEIDNTLKDQKFDKLVLDFSHISYISSAGLRIMLKLKQTYGNVSIIETTLEVYDIFNMTGFTNIMDIKKGLKRVYLSVVRECVGVVETVAFPFGWEPIIEPAYVYDGGEETVSWKVYKPAFHKRY